MVGDIALWTSPRPDLNSDTTRSGGPRADYAERAAPAPAHRTAPCPNGSASPLPPGRVGRSGSCWNREPRSRGGGATRGPRRFPTERAPG